MTKFLRRFVLAPGVALVASLALAPAARAVPMEGTINDCLAPTPPGGFPGFDPLRLPCALDDVADTLANTPVTIDVLANDLKNDAGTFEILNLGIPDFGTVSLTSDFLSVLYLPPLDFVGLATFTYTITDNFNDGDNVDFGIGSVFVQVSEVSVEVPEPETLALLAAGLLAAALRRRRGTSVT